MIDNQAFIEATNFLKYKKKIKIGDIATAIGINRGRMDNLRRNGVPLDLTEAKELVRVYPDTLKFFTENFEETDTMKMPLSDKVHDPLVLYDDGQAWRELSKTQKKLLEALEHRLAKQEEELKELAAENRFLRAKVMELEKKP